MPTGYTAKLYDGEQSFEDFIATCARGMGVAITMRDESFDKRIPEKFEPDQYHVKALAAAKEKLRKAVHLTEEEAEDLAQEAYAEAVTAAAEAEKTRLAQVHRYQDMKARVESWVPPTAEHTNFKMFMLEQLELGFGHERDHTAFDHVPPFRSGTAYRADLIDSAVRDIEYHTEHLVKDEDRARSRTAWIVALRESL